MKTTVDFTDSDLLPNITSIIGKTNRRDILHIDSAYKTGCQIFLTSDKKDIWSKRSDLEPLLSMKIFYSASESDLLIEHIKITQDKNK